MVLSHRSLRCLLAVGVALWALAAPAQSPPAAGGPPCDPWVARLISFQGRLDVRASGYQRAARVSLNDTFCVGDVLQVGAYSRAALQLPDQTVVRVGPGTVLTFAAPKDDKRTWLDILRGIIHIISRDPRALRVITPFANAGIEGTEFYVGVTDAEATVIVFEGRVAVTNAAGAATAGSGESVLARAGQAPVLQQVVRPRDAVTWTLFYPPTSTGPLPAADAEPPTGQADAAFYIGRAERRLGVGLVAGAEADLQQALALAPGSGEVLARQSVIALTQNDTARAVQLADQAVAAAPESAAARLARSYTRQAQFNLPGAIEDLQAAAVAHPDNALVQARLAEMWLATGDVRRSEQSARAAVAADPQLALAHTVLGFNQLTRIDLASAEATFQEAIRLQPADPLPWLGLGLTRIRGGHLAAGREDIQNAVILDPSGSLLRSYMGKAYFEERRDKLSASQFQLAKELDPLDPTPWFYDALRQQTVNQPVRALEQLRTSIELNDNRGVYRSRLLLDDDAAVRNAGVSAIYNELGFPVLAVVEGTDGLAQNFGNSSAHRLLANAYADLPRYDISRVSEALQAQIRQPLSVPPIDLRESTDNQILGKGVAAAQVGVNEFNSLFNRDQLRLEVDGTVGSLGTAANQVVFSGLEGRTGFALSQLHEESDGFSENSAVERNVYDGFLQYQISPVTNMQLDVRYSDYSLGYTFNAFDPDLANTVDTSEDADLYRFNGRHQTSPGSDLIWTLAYSDRRRDTRDYFTGELFVRTEFDTYVAELQRLDRVGDLQLISGAGYVVENGDYLTESSTIDTDDANAYIYAQWRPRGDELTLIGGFSLDLFNADYDFGLPTLERQHLSPKLGLVWSPNAGATTVRAAAFQSLRRPLVAEQTIEPTQVASFNQFFTGLEQFYGDEEGTVSRRVGLAVDQVFSESLFGGVQGALRHLVVPYLTFEFDEFGEPSFAWANRSWREKSASAYLYKTFGVGPDSGTLAGWSASLSLSGGYEELSRPRESPGSEGILDLDTITVPLGLAIFSPGGAGFRIVTSYVRQDGEFSVDALFPIFPKKDDGWITDVLLQYRLPKRYGILSAGVRNLFDHEIDVFEPDPLNPQVATQRLVAAGFSLTF